MSGRELTVSCGNPKTYRKATLRHLLMIKNFSHREGLILKLIKRLDSLVTSEGSLTLRAAMQVIDRGSLQTALVVDHNGNLAGILTDGDVRRALLMGASLEDSAFPAINRHPICVSEDSLGKARELAARKEVSLIILGEIGAPPVGIYVLKPRFADQTMPPALLMAGGKGVRLRPLTLDKPKPLIEVAGIPILHRVLNTLSSNGFTKVFLSVNYLGDQVELSIGDGYDFGLEVEYIHEEEPMGTAGSLGLLPNFADFQDLLVMNADLLAEIDFSGFIMEHRLNNNDFTVAVREHLTQVHFGVIRITNGMVAGVQEKPNYSDLVSAGIYCLSSSLSSLIPNGPMDMPDLINSAISNGKKVGAFPIHRSWIDIGSHGDLERANTLLAGES